ASTDFFDMLKQSDVFPTTSQISPAAFEQAFREELQTHETLIVVTLSSKGSGTYQSACIARDLVLEDMPEADIVLIDSLSFCSGYGMIVVEAAQMLKDGCTKQEIIDHITNSCANLEIYILADTLEYLKKGGRVSNIAALIGGMLNIRPILTVRDGMVASKGKLRGNKNIMPRFIEEIQQDGYDFSNTILVIAHGAAPEKAAEFKQLAQLHLKPKGFYEAELGCVIGAHTGPGVMAAFFVKTT
ncbi:MAG: DegV family protein, partial [Hyphomonadaceae bacterium]|nr:DegV family protein [Clostridia bacterium]